MLVVQTNANVTNISSMLRVAGVSWSLNKNYNLSDEEKKSLSSNQTNFSDISITCCTSANEGLRVSNHTKCTKQIPPGTVADDVPRHDT